MLKLMVPISILALKRVVIYTFTRNRLTPFAQCRQCARGDPCMLGGHGLIKTRFGPPKVAQSPLGAEKVAQSPTFRSKSGAVSNFSLKKWRSSPTFRSKSGGVLQLFAQKVAEFST